MHGIPARQRFSLPATSNWHGAACASSNGPKARHLCARICGMSFERLFSLPHAMGLTTTVVEACGVIGLRASAKGHELDLLPVPRSEYLALDVTAFAEGPRR